MTIKQAKYVKQLLGNNILVAVKYFNLVSVPLSQKPIKTCVKITLCPNCAWASFANVIYPWDGWLLVEWLQLG